MTNIFDQHADDYSERINRSLGRFGATHDFFMAHKTALLDQVLQEHGFDAGRSRLLDVGCGTAMLHGLISEKFASIDGVDISKESLRVAADAHPGNRYTTYDGRHLPFEDESFDISTAIAVFHHVPPPQWHEMAREMLRVTRQGGLGIVIEHNPFNPVTWHIVNTCDLDEDAVLLRPAQLREIFAGAGGEEIYTRTVLNVPPVGRFLSSVDRMLGWLPLGAQYYMVARRPRTPPRRSTEERDR